MRAVMVLLGGSGSAWGAWALSGMFGGFLGAACFMLSIFIAPVVIGIAIAMGTQSYRAAGPGIAPGRTSLQDGLDASRTPSDCSECGGFRLLRGTIWVCGPCDLGVTAADI